MSKTICLLLAFFVFISIPAAVFAFGARPGGDIWSFYHFDHGVFLAGPAVDGSAFIAVRENVLPVILTSLDSTMASTPLPSGTGVIAGICYLQSSGGKLNPGSGFKPRSHEQFQISSGGKEFVRVQADDHGYFMAVLPAGSYAIGSGTLSIQITVERGMTKLVPLRIGKRMVD